MDCHKAVELLPGYVLDTLSTAERAQILQHLNGGCRACQVECQELTLAAHSLAESLAPVAPRPELKQTLLDRIAGKELSTASSRRSTKVSGARRSSSFPYIVASLAAVAVGSLVANYKQYQDLEIAQAEAQTPPEWEYNAEATERVFGAPKTQLTSFARNVANEKLTVSIFHDLLAGQLHVLIANAAPPGENETLWLWLLDEEGSVLTGGALEYLGENRAAGILDLKGIPESAIEAVISSEPTGEHIEPSGPKLGRARLERTS